MGLITPFDPWKNKFCTCPGKYSLSAYTGCSGGCLYCYASSYIPNFASPRPKKDFKLRLEKEIKRIPSGSTIAMANSSDPYQVLEKRLNLTRQALKIMAKYDLKIHIVTKSHFILKDLDILRSFKKITVSISITTLKKELARRLEPSNSVPDERLRAAEEISKYIPVIVRFDPIIYPLNAGEIGRIISCCRETGVKQIITSTYKAKKNNLQKMMDEFPEHKNIWQEIYLQKGEKKHNSIYLEENFRKKIIDLVRESALKNKMLFSSCREGFSHLNTAHCDGSSLLRQ